MLTSSPQKGCNKRPLNLLQQRMLPYTLSPKKICSSFPLISNLHITLFTAKHFLSHASLFAFSDALFSWSPSISPMGTCSMCLAGAVGPRALFLAHSFLYYFQVHSSRYDQLYAGYIYMDISPSTLSYINQPPIPAKFYLHVVFTLLPLPRQPSSFVTYLLLQ